jgi:hypothetical protein
MNNPNTVPFTGAAQGRPLSVIDPVAFKLLFTMAERVAIYNAAKTDPNVWDFLSILDDPRLKLVDRTDITTITALDYLVSIELLTSDRYNTILGNTA